MIADGFPRATTFRPSFERYGAAEVVKKCHWDFYRECNIVVCVQRRDVGAGWPWGFHHDSNRKGTVGVRPAHRRTCRACYGGGKWSLLLDESSLLGEVRVDDKFPYAFPPNNVQHVGRIVVYIGKSEIVNWLIFHPELEEKPGRYWEKRSSSTWSSMANGNQFIDGHVCDDKLKINCKQDVQDNLRF